MTITITGVHTVVDAHGLTVHRLAFDNGLTGFVTDAKHRTPAPGGVGKTLAGVTLKRGDTFGLTTMPTDWNPSVGDGLTLPPRWVL